MKGETLNATLYIAFLRITLKLQFKAHQAQVYTQAIDACDVCEGMRMNA